MTLPEKGLVRADPAYRRRMVIILAIVVLFGAVIIIHANNYFHEVLSLSKSAPQEAILALKHYLYYFMAANLIFFLPFFLYFFSLAIRTIASKQFPPPRAKVLRDTYKQVGSRATISGIVLLLFSLLVCLFALVVPLLVQNMFHTILQ
ncbi:MAG: hypothetical protein J7K89_07855 [Candidatus Cloacimonetes bacterium]|nr:hypothetical protein [Candidatus Cloacimonadota bacterium]